MIPYTLSSEGHMRTCLATYKNGQYPYLQTEVKGLELKFIDKIFKSSICNLLYFIMRYGRRFDILQMYHYDRKSLYCLFFFKLVTFFKGKTYLKLDADHHVKDFRYVGFNGWVASRLMKTIDLVSVESKELYHFMNAANIYQRPVIYIPNGYTPVVNSELSLLKKRSDLILTVGRIGTLQKGTDILLEAFAKVSDDLGDWKMHLIGPMEVSFQSYVQDFFIKYPALADRIYFTGEVTDRDALRKMYGEAKLFVLPSRYESFGFVCLEAIDAGCYLIASDLGPILDVTNRGLYASLFPSGDANSLAEVIKQAANTPIDTLQNKAVSAKQYIESDFRWPTICSHIAQLLWS